MGRASKFRQELFDEICFRISEGESLLSVCRSPGMPTKQAVLRWLNTNPGLRAQYDFARVIRADLEFERILEIADNVETASGCVAKARLQIDARKWVLSRMNPKKYGNKVEMVERPSATHKSSVVELVAVNERPGSTYDLVGNFRRAES